MNLKILEKQGILKPQFYELLDDLTIESTTVPAGYQTDGTSIPKPLCIPLIFTIVFLDDIYLSCVMGVFTILVFMFDKKDIHFIKQAIYHDYLIDHGNISRFEADRLFFKALMNTKTNVFVCIVFYFCVTSVSMWYKVKEFFDDNKARS